MWPFKKLKLNKMNLWSAACDVISVSACKKWIHCGLVTPYGDIDLGQHWFRQWLVAWRTKPLSEPVLNLHYWGTVAFTREQFHDSPSYYLCNTFEIYSFKITASSPRGQWVKLILVGQHKYHILHLTTYMISSGNKILHITFVIVTFSISCMSWVLYMLLMLMLDE